MRWQRVNGTADHDISRPAPTRRTAAGRCGRPRAGRTWCGR
ncbi:unnamed protein product [[Actinomadura] parvosata subsp. kistnae]|nr:unnamed protein product [Actinomadura parvosata subsp. kistnae]